MRTTGDIRIGISGWRYEGWRGTFYPPDLPQRRELEFASSRLNSIEINGTFYSLQRPESFRRWYEEAPPGFVFSVKGVGFITHMRRLLQVEGPLANFFAQGLLSLKEKLGPILWQFPPNFKYDPARLDSFLALLPRTHKEAALFARGHEPRLEGRTWFDVDEDRPLRYAIETRHDSFVNDDYIALLRRHNIALVVADTVEWPLLFDVTSDFVYCRLHGSEQLHVSGYDPEAIHAWALRILSWARGGEVEGKKASATSGPTAKTRDLYVYFDNDVKVRAPVDAQQLRKCILELETGATPERPREPKRRNAGTSHPTKKRTSIPART